jgi:hypothetical protein
VAAQWWTPIDNEDAHSATRTTGRADVARRRANDTPNRLWQKRRRPENHPGRLRSVADTQLWASHHEHLPNYARAGAEAAIEVIFGPGTAIRFSAKEHRDLPVVIPGGIPNNSDSRCRSTGLSTTSALRLPTLGGWGYNNSVRKIKTKIPGH